MIFVILGTQKQQMKRVEKIILESKELKEKKIVIQSGYTKFENEHENIEMIPFLDEEKFIENIRNAEYIITHGGVGSIATALENKKKVIAVSRCEKFGEHIDNHQIELCDKLYSLGYIEHLHDKEDIDEKICKMSQKEYATYETDKKYINVLEAAIESM